MSVLWLGLFSGVLLTVMTLAAGELVRLRRIKREIRELTAYTEQVQDKTQLPSMDTMQEGRSEFSKVRYTSLQRRCMSSMPGKKRAAGILLRCLKTFLIR